jgi:hypothetical protein
MKIQGCSRPGSGSRCTHAAVLRLAALFATATAVSSLNAQKPELSAPSLILPAPGDPAIVTLQATAPVLSRLTLMESDNLVGRWTPAAPGVVALRTTTPFAIPYPDGLSPRRFYRVEVSPPRITATEKDGDITVEVREDGATFPELEAALALATGSPALLVTPYDPATPDTLPEFPSPTIPKGTFRGTDLASLGTAMGLPLWNAGPKEDDPRTAANFKPDTSTGTPQDVPGDGGSGVIDSGWQGDGIKELPSRADSLPPPGSFDMIYKPDDSSDSKDPQTDEAPGTAGSHLRLGVLFTKDTIKFTRATERPTGLGTLTNPFTLPPEGSFVLVVRSAKGDILHLLPFADPRHERAYAPPQGGSHGFSILPEASFTVTIPVPGKEFAADLSDLSVSIHSVTGIPQKQGSLLTPLTILRNPNLFPESASIAGPALLDLLRSSGGRAAPKAATRAPTVTTLHRSGTDAEKFNVAIIGDGFRDTTTDQNTFNNYAASTVMDTLRTRDIHPAVLNGMNVFRVNTYSEQSGMTTVNASGTVVTARSTALEYRFSGNWNRCWMEPGPNSQALIDAAINAVCPQADFIVLVLNTTGFGGCAGGNRFTVTLGADWTVVAHEFGHRPGTLGDEYTCGGTCGCYSGGEPGSPNLTAVTTRASIKWNEWIPSWRPIPTSAAHVADQSQDVGLFPGATIGSGQWTSCIFRPSFRGRMNNNAPPHNPVGFTNVREQFRPYQNADMRRRCTGDFNGDGHTDVVLHDGRQLALYTAGDRDPGPADPVSGATPRSVNGTLQPTWFHTDMLENAAATRSWQIRPTDRLVAGDFDGDGRDDLFIINLTGWSYPYVGLLRSLGSRFEPVARYAVTLPGWEMRPGDQFFSTDFSGDGKDDLCVYNGTNWSIPYFGMLRCTGSSLQMSRRYDKFFPGWEMGRQERFIQGDFNKDGRRDLATLETQSWAQVHFMTFLSTGTQLSLSDRYYGTIPGFWQMRRNDQLFALDSNGDGETDLAIFNGLDWNPVYLGYLNASGGKISGRRRYDNDKNPLPGWPLQRRDQFFPGNTDGDADDDLVVYNKDNWSTQRLGILRSNPSSTSGFSAIGSFQSDWINGWNLGPADQFTVSEFRGASGWADLFVCNDGWFGLLRGYQTHFRLESIYRKWIHNHRYHGSGLW